MERCTALGIMSGSSMDGSDMALVRFEFNKDWNFQVLASGTQPLSPACLSAIEKGYKGTAQNLALAHNVIGEEFGTAAKIFLEKNKVQAELISSHGHTIFHRPDLGMTFQAGNGAVIAAITGIDTICDLRSIDIALGGQGAPLVPLGEKFLFPGNKLFLNLGGIANISIHGETIAAFDICPCNMMLNLLSREMGKAFDEDGALARAGALNENLLDRLKRAIPKNAGQPFSLGREHFEAQLKPLLLGAELSTQDKLNTTVEAIAWAIGNAIPEGLKGPIFITGGGAFNAYLVERIEELSGIGIHLPEPNIIEFKEAIIFAFLGVLRLRNEVNCSSEATGAIRDNIGGAIYAGNSHDHT